MMLVVKRFAAGFLATLLVHQVIIAGLFYAGVIPRPPYSMMPVPPFGVPAVLSLSFWGGLWGIIVLWLVDRVALRFQLAMAAALGAIGPPLVAWFVVAPMKGRPLPGSVREVLLGLLINAAWAIGTLVIYRLLARRPAVGRAF